MIGAHIPVDIYEDFSADFTSDTNFTLNNALRIGNMVFLCFNVTNVNISAGGAFSKNGLISSHFPKSTVAVSLYSGNNSLPSSLMAGIDKYGNFAMRAGGGAVSSGAYIVTACYAI